jgi:hypothetical protein
MSNPVRPLLFGYIRVHLLMTNRELNGVKQRLAEFADVEGYALANIFIEQAHTVPAAFQALVDAARKHEVKTVVVPGLQHLKVLPPGMKEHLEHYAGAHVITAVPATPQADEAAS